ncbi:MAG: hypothetical protein NT141_03965 [candidate division WWE3 bacterium]|nr:hypothetical protein [candidate division WWE3 bacterium]
MKDAMKLNIWIRKQLEERCGKFDDRTGVGFSQFVWHPLSNRGLHEQYLKPRGLSIQAPAMSVLWTVEFTERSVRFTPKVYLIDRDDFSQRYAKANVEIRVALREQFNIVSFELATPEPIVFLPGSSLTGGSTAVLRSDAVAEIDRQIADLEAFKKATLG